MQLSGVICIYISLFFFSNVLAAPIPQKKLIDSDTVSKTGVTKPGDIFDINALVGELGEGTLNNFMV